MAYQSLRKKILAAMIIAPAIPFVLVLAIGYYSFTKALEDEAVSRMVRIANDHRDSVQLFLDERRTDLEFVASIYGFRQASEPATLELLLSNLQAKSPVFVDLGVFDAAGTHVAYQGPYELRGRDYSGEEWFQEVLRRGYYVSDVFLGFRRSPHFVIAIADGSGSGRWVLRATIDTVLFTGLVERVRIGRTGEA